MVILGVTCIAELLSTCGPDLGHRETSPYIRTEIMKHDRCRGPFQPATSVGFKQHQIPLHEGRRRSRSNRLRCCGILAAKSSASARQKRTVSASCIPIISELALGSCARGRCTLSFPPSPPHARSARVAAAGSAYAYGCDKIDDIQSRMKVEVEVDEEWTCGLGWYSTGR